MSDQLAAALQQAIDGLFYPSETDAPFEVLHWPDCPGPLPPEEILSRAGHAPSTPVTQQTLDQFFADLTQDRDWYGEEERATAQRYRDLRSLLRRHLPDAQVFRLGRVQLDIYVLARTADGRCVGLKTTSVET